MNIITRSFTTLAKTYLGRTATGTNCAAITHNNNAPISGGGGSLLTAAKTFLDNSLQGLQQIRNSSLYRMHRLGPHKKHRPNKNPFGFNVPFAKGIVLKTLIRKPKKPNSANRKCVLVRLSNGKEMTAYIPGEGHNLQEHNIVLCKVGRTKDLPGVKIKCVRGKYDLAHVMKKSPT